MKNNTTNKIDDDIVMFFSDPEKMRQAIQKGVRSALREHQLAGNSICEWRENKIHWISADKIQLS